MRETTRLVLLRHAEPAWEPGRVLGASDPALSPQGLETAEALARALARVPFDVVYASTARRALETAAPLAAACGLELVVEERLRELDFGSFEGRSYAEIEADDPATFRAWMETPTRVRFPGGESYAELRARTLAVVEALHERHRGGLVALVAHAGPLRAILAACLGLADEAIFRLELAHGAASIVDWGETPAVGLVNGSPPSAAARLAASADSGGRRRGLLERPPLPPGYDDSRAHVRRARPDGWRFEAAERAGVWRAIAERRDIRRFRPDPLPDRVLERLLEAAHRAPSVGLMQPWRFVVVRSEETKAAMQGLAARERLVQADHFDARARQYLDLKIEGIREAPLGVCVCCDRGEEGAEVLGRHTIPDTDLYSTCLAIENLWLAARAEGVGVGWVSFYRPDDLRRLLALPERVVPVAWLCVGYPDERPSRPGLEAAGWQRRWPLARVVHEERWHDVQPAPRAAPAAQSAVPGAPARPAWWQRLAGSVAPGDPEAALRVRDASDELVKPAGSLGVLEGALERLALASGGPPLPGRRAAILVLAADNGVAARAVSLYPARVGAQVAAAAARGETAIGVLARALDAELVVADVGLRGPRPAGLVDRRVSEGSADIAAGPALGQQELRAAVEAGYELARELASRCELVVLGEIGIGNTTVAAALLAALCGLGADAVCGRGTGLDAQGLEAKRAVVEEALDRNRPDGADPLECLRRVGGLELAALTGATLGAASKRRPVLLDGFATGVAALVACRLEPAVRDYLLAGHRSAEPAHDLVLTELGIEPLLDLRMRLGEGSGAALALPLLDLAARLHAEMSRFLDAGVEPARRSHSPVFE